MFFCFFFPSTVLSTSSNFEISHDPAIESLNSTTYIAQHHISSTPPFRPIAAWCSCVFLTCFQLNASIHHALPSITRRAVRDFGRKMVTESREELIDHFTVADLDTVADRIIAKASDSFLDKCLEKRLLTIEAKPLINALAKAERLGYDPNDIVQEDHHERVIPQEAYPGAASATAPTFSQQPPSQPPQSYSPANPTTQCGRCFRTFTYPSSHDYVSDSHALSGQ